MGGSLNEPNVVGTRGINQGQLIRTLRLVQVLPLARRRGGQRGDVRARRRRAPESEERMSRCQTRQLQETGTQRRRRRLGRRRLRGRIDGRQRALGVLLLTSQLDRRPVPI